MSYPGRIIRATPVIPALGSAKGIWTLAEALQAKAQGTWPTVGLITRTYLTSNTEEHAGKTSWSWAAQTFGAVTSGRRLALLATARSGEAAMNISAATLGGASCTRIANQDIAGDGVGRNAAAIFTVDTDPGGTTGTVAITTSANSVRVGWSLFALFGTLSGAAADTDNLTGDPTDGVGIDCLANGVILAIAMSQASTTATAVGTGMSENFDGALGSGNTYWSGSGEFASTQTGLVVGGDFGTATAAVGCAASFNP